MQRRSFMLKAGSLAAAVALAGCRTSGTATTPPADESASSERRRRDIDASVGTTIDRLYATVKGSRELAAKSVGQLVFPSVIAAGLGVGGEYGEGALRVGNASVGYYSLASVSFGLQIGAQSKAIIMLFMTRDALDKFRKSEGWSAGVDASVAVLKAGANGELDVSAAAGQPVVAFVLTNAGLMANLTLEGSKITRLKI